MLPNDEPAGTVVSSDPAAGTQVEPGSTITINVSLGSGGQPGSLGEGGEGDQGDDSGSGGAQPPPPTP